MFAIAFSLFLDRVVKRGIICFADIILIFLI